MPIGRSATPVPDDVSAHARRTMISTSHPMATEAGLAIMRKGGSAVDAYIAAALVQCVVEPVMTSLAGGFSITVFEPSRCTSRSVHGVAALPMAETGPFDEAARWSGRTVVPPGWLAGAHAAWRAWGRIDWEDLFGPAITAAREGFLVDQQLWGYMFEARMRAGRFAEGRAVWYPQGTMVGVGELLVQHELANTLENAASEGLAYVYEGEFAKNYVATAQAHGGRITLDDMAQCAAIGPSDVPTLTLANGAEIQTNSLLYALALNLAMVGEIDKCPPPSDDPESLYLLLRIVEEAWNTGLELAGDLLSPEARPEVLDAMSVESALGLWPDVVKGPARPFDSMNMETNALVVTDEAGLVAHGTHSTSSIPFGVGLLVDGVIVPRPLYYFAEPFVTLPAGWGTSLLLVQDGVPQFVAGSPSVSAFQSVLQNTLNVTAWGMEPGVAVQQPRFGAPLFPSRRPIVEATFSQEHLDLLDKRDLDVTTVSPWEPEMGSCHAIRFNQDGSLDGCADPRRFGRVAGD